MRHVFSMETEREKDLQALAETIVNCQLRRKAKSCRDNDCGRCPTYAHLERCMAELPSCDTLRVRNMAQELYGLREFQYGLDTPSFREWLREAGKCAWTIAYTLVGCALIGAAFIAAVLLSLSIMWR